MINTSFVKANQIRNIVLPEICVKGDISRETNGPNIRAMVSLGILIFLGTFSVWQTD